MEEILKVQGLKKTFKLSAKQQKIEKTKEKVKVAVNDLSFTAYRGEVFGLLGPNGAGKTTTLRMLATLIRPDGGDAVLDGASIVMEPEEVRSKIGFLTSELKLEDFFTPNYLFDFFADLHGMDAESRKQRKELLFKRFGIDEFAEVKVGNLSTGMKQRLGLARVLAGQAELLLMDEPFASLDFLTRAELQSQLLAIQEKLPRTIVLVTHQLEEALLLGRRIIVMHPDSTICEFDLTDSPYPRDLDDPTLRRLKKAITDQCRYTA